MSTAFNEAVEHEKAYLAKVYPKPEDVPGCMRVLDEFLVCHALGPQLKSLYRYGNMAECSQKMSDFKFCMSLKSVSAETKREAWIQRRAEWWAERRLAKSSEDVWEIRKQPLPGFPPPPVDMAAFLDSAT